MFTDGNSIVCWFSPKSLLTFRQIWHLIRVRRIGTILAGWICLTAIAAHAAHTQVRLILSADTAKSRRYGSGPAWI